MSCLKLKVVVNFLKIVTQLLLFLYLGLDTVECYKSVIPFVVQGCYTRVLRVLAKDLCRNEYGIPFLAHKSGYNETRQTSASSLRELRR